MNGVVANGGAVVADGVVPKAESPRRSGKRSMPEAPADNDDGGDELHLHSTDVPCKQCTAAKLRDGSPNKRPREGSVVSPEATDERLEALSASIPSRVAEDAAVAGGGQAGVVGVIGGGGGGGAAAAAEATSGAGGNGSASAVDILQDAATASAAATASGASSRQHGRSRSRSSSSSSTGSNKLESSTQGGAGGAGGAGGGVLSSALVRGGLSSSSSSSEKQQQQEEDRMAKMRGAVRTMLECLGEDPDREGLMRTPERVAKAMLFFTEGYAKSLKSIVNGAIFEENHHEMVVVRNIDLHSLCEHHMVPFIGKCHIGYIPKRKVVGLSKLARIVDMFARRLQVQERLTKQIAQAVMDILSPLGVAVVIECSHMCMVMRGVQKSGASTVTSSVLGAFQKDPRTRSEFFSHIRGQSSC